MSSNNTPKNIGGHRTKGDLNEHGAKSRANTIIRVKEAWGVSELMDIFPKEIRPKDDLGSTTVTILRSITNLCPDLKKAQQGMLRVCRNPDGSYKPFSFSQCKQFAEQLKEAKNMLSAGDNQSAKKKAATPKTSTPATPANFDTSAAPSSSPLKGKQVKKDKAQAAGQELLMSIGKASAAPATTEEDEGDSIVVDTAPRQKSNKKARASLGQEKHEQTLPLTPAATAPVAVMTTPGSPSPSKAAAAPVAVMSKDGSQTSGKAAKVPVAAMSADGPQASRLKAKPIKKGGIVVSGYDSDSEDSGSEDVGIPDNILDLLDGNAVPVKVAEDGFAKSAGKPAAVSHFTTAETIGRMVVPSRELKHPFSNKHQKRLEQGETPNPPTNKPAQIKKPFTNLMTSVPPKPKTSEQPSRRIQKATEMKEALKMDFQTEPVIIQNAVDSNKGIQSKSAGPLNPRIQRGGDMKKDSEMDIQAKAAIQHVVSCKQAQLDNGTSPAEANKDVTMTEVTQSEVAGPTAKATRTLLPSSPQKKRTASTMLRAADEPNPQAQRSIRARLDDAAPFNNERVISDLLQYERVITTITQASMESVTASSFASSGGRDGQEAKAEESKQEYASFLAAVMLSARTLKDRLLEIAEREE